jgi:hypothetical protein
MPAAQVRYLSCSVPSQLLTPRLRDKSKDVCLETARGLKKMECGAMITRFHDNDHRTAKLAKWGTTLTHFARS